jgi:hypothetical protein
MNVGSFESSTSSLIAGLLFPSIGFYVFRKSRQQMSVKLALVGVAMMLWPYFAPSDALEWVGGFAMCGLCFYWWDKDL